MGISIIVPTLNRPNQLFELLKKLSKIIADDEIIIVDDSQKSQEKYIMESFSSPITYINRGEKLGVSSARNVGAFSANNTYLIFLDDDDEFTENWLNDFRNLIYKKPDLVFCNMVRVEPNGKKIDVKVSENRNGAMGNSIVIPGSWMIKKSLFEKIKGYDEQILFAENTELFFRVFEAKPTTYYINNFNFIYHPCPTGGSKNLQNMIDSLTIILDKHSEILTSHVKHLYHQIIGVNSMRFRNFSQARYHLYLAIRYKPLKASTYGRLGLACLPFLAKRLYTEKVNYG
ncbi:Glycosyltransferase, GT2 family [Algoriphagus alkaliphilus]|uniref:Glycosyltransferase, GT2 family n=1 Tax=Algoriphagus alkaliphilus TaxID=279824 RepID=A0A1G5ZP99_9BACT|nr:glycosyltransferase family 2 protein [Algoriphagus alkaliphilus]SDA96346.1 Glycosyltransferase, GT2 family [Algoriphagus alkaliphilus]